MSAALSDTQETEARHLVEAVTQAAHDDLLQIARTLVATTPETLFGATEFHIRDVILGLAAKILAQHLAQKKTVTTAPASSAPTVRPRRTTTATATAPS